MAANSPDFSLASDLELLRQAAIAAGRIALGFFRAENRTWMKSGNSPVSQADIAVDKFLHETLMAGRPHYGWLSEESVQQTGSDALGTCFVVDPVDGTRGFLEGDPNWCVSIALVRGGIPFAGVVNCPALGRLFCAAFASGASLNGVTVTGAKIHNIPRITASKRLNEELSRLYPERFTILPYIPSLACRLVMVASGELDGAYARAGAHDWDLAAAQIILEEAGGKLTGLDGNRLAYNGVQARNPALIAAGPGHHDIFLSLAKSGGFLQ